MRSIKFRAWDKDDQRMYKVVRISDAIWGEDEEKPSVLICGFNANPLNIMTNISQSNNYELMQFTGLKDANGKEIYEGDILSRNGHWGHYVGFEKGCFVTIPLDKVQRINWAHNTLISIDLTQWEVKGNIYENLDLLGESE